MEIKRCDWCLKDDLYIQYHDTEWGIPQHNDTKLFEMLILETFQAGLSWHTILKRREGFKRAFANFDVEKVAAFGEEEINKLMNDTGIIRYRAKIEAAIHNAKIFIQIQKEFGSFDKYIWQFTGYKTIHYKPEQMKDYKVSTPESDTMTKDMKKRGFKFIGTTTNYALMQSIGMVEEHLTSCFRKKELQ